MDEVFDQLIQVLQLMFNDDCAGRSCVGCPLNKDIQLTVGDDTREYNLCNVLVEINEQTNQ